MEARLLREFGIAAGLATLLRKLWKPRLPKHAARGFLLFKAYTRRAALNTVLAVPTCVVIEYMPYWPGMNTYTVTSCGNGWFQVTVLSQEGESHIRDGFVSELAARKWVNRRLRSEAKQESAISDGRTGLMATKRLPAPRSGPPTRQADGRYSQAIASAKGFCSDVGGEVVGNISSRHCGAIATGDGMHQSSDLSIADGFLHGALDLVDCAAHVFASHSHPPMPQLRRHRLGQDS